MVKYNLKYKPNTIVSNNEGVREVILTRIKQETPSRTEKTSPITLYDVFRIVRNILGVYVSVYLLGSANKYINKV